MSNPRKHFVLVAFPAFGHIIPTLELAKKIVHFHDVTFVVSAVKLSVIRERNLMPPLSEYPITFLPLEDGLTPENDKNVSAGQLSVIANASNEALRKLYATVAADFVIADFPIAASLDACHARNIATGVFHTASAAALCNKLAVTETTVTIPDEQFLHPRNGNADIGAHGIPESMKQNNLSIQAAMKNTQAIILNSIRELEPQAINFLAGHRVTKDKDVLFVGPLFPVDTDSDDTVVQWLDKQAYRNVVYVSFGSLLIDFPAKQLTEIWMTLISLNRPFLWVLKEREETCLKALNLPETDTDHLIVRWAPQKLVLTHPATAIFVSHCGWNSTMESVWGGVPVVAWPMAADQHQNSQFLVDSGVALKIPNTSMLFERVISTQQIGQRVLELTGWSNGPYGSEFTRCCGIMKEQARAAVAAGGSSDNEFKKLVGSSP